MATWYVRPDTSHSATRDGTTYATAWGGWSEIVWGASGVNAGDTLYVCGNHAYSASSLTVGAHGGTSDSTRATIRGDYAASPGVIAFSASGWFDASRQWTTLKNLTINSTATGFNCIFTAAVNGVIIDGCTLSGADAGVGLNSSTVFSSLTIKNCTMSGHSIAGVNYGLTAASSASSGITVTGNTIHDTGLYGINLSITSSAWATSTLVNLYIANNTVYNTPGPSIYLRTCNSDLVTDASVYSSGLVVSGNTVHNCGVTAGASGNHGSPVVMGFINPVIANNTVRDCFVTGAGIQTAKNKNPLIFFNRITGIRSGTPTSGYQNGLPIDGNGIFFDIFTSGGVAYGNYIADLISTGNANSGTALAFWHCSGARFIGNVVENCYVGASYGHSTETGNEIYHNTFISCTKGVDKVGTDALTGNLTVKNNIFSACTNGFTIGANPGITADYNCIYGATTPYSGISAGANDLSVNPQLDANYRPQAAALKRSAVFIGGMDYNGKQFYNPPNFGAVDDKTTTPRYFLR